MCWRQIEFLLTHLLCLSSSKSQTVVTAIVATVGWTTLLSPKGRDGKNLLNSTGKTLSLKNKHTKCSKLCNYEQKCHKLKNKQKNFKNCVKKPHKFEQLWKISTCGACAACISFHLCRRAPKWDLSPGPGPQSPPTVLSGLKICWYQSSPLVENVWRWTLTFGFVNKRNMSAKVFTRIIPWFLIS